MKLYTVQYTATEHPSHLNAVRPARMWGTLRSHRPTLHRTGRKSYLMTLEEEGKLLQSTPSCRETSTPVVDGSLPGSLLLLCSCSLTSLTRATNPYPILQYYGKLRERTIYDSSRHPIDRRKIITAFTCSEQSLHLTSPCYLQLLCRRSNQLVVTSTLYRPPLPIDNSLL